MDSITEAYIDLNEALPKKGLTVNQAKKVLEILDGTRARNGGERAVGIHHAIKDLKAIDGKVSFNVTKFIKIFKAAEDAFKKLSKLSDAEIKRVESTEEGEAASHSFY